MVVCVRVWDELMVRLTNHIPHILYPIYTFFSLSQLLLCYIYNFCFILFLGGCVGWGGMEGNEIIYST